jgi:hypothetical protein
MRNHKRPKHFYYWQMLKASTLREACRVHSRVCQTQIALFKKEAAWQHTLSSSAMKNC